jgi:hypothetical protein
METNGTASDWGNREDKDSTRNGGGRRRQQERSRWNGQEELCRAHNKMVR